LQINADGQGYLLGFPLATGYVVSVDTSQLPDYYVEGAVFRWPNTDDAWMGNIWIQAVGILYGLLVLFGTAWVLLRWARGDRHPA